MKTMNTLKNLLATERTHTTCTPEPTYKALRDYLNPYGDSFEKAELELTASVELNLSREQLLELEDPAVLADRQINFYMPESEIDSIMDARTEDEVLAAEFGFDNVKELDRWMQEQYERDIISCYYAGKDFSCLDDSEEELPF